MNLVEDVGIIPVDFSAISNFIGDFKAPKDKISKLEKSGKIIRLKKGMFVLSPEYSKQKISKELVANHLLGPSYISVESALAYFGIIPETVYTTKSVTTKRKKVFSTPLGNYEYLSVPEAYFPIGIKSEFIDDSGAFLIATPEKALCDLIITTSHLRIQSKKAMLEYLVEDLRVDLSLNPFSEMEILKECMDRGRKKRELRLLYELLR
jgi:predicted transcriptional regulator of viral defense system